MKKIFALVLCAVLLLTFPGCVNIPSFPLSPTAAPAATATAAPTATPEPTPTPIPTPTPTPAPTPTPVPAHEVSVTLSDNVGAAVIPIQDGNVHSGVVYPQGTVIHVEAAEPFAALYLYWNKTPPIYTVEGEDFSVAGGLYGILHEYLPLEKPVTSADIVLNGLAPLYELKAYSEGEVPADVQIWEPPCLKADIMVFAAHADDDVIFFGGIMANAVDRGLNVQVCYLVDHSLPGGVQYADRNHELLNSLWEMGIRHYPVVGPFPDYYVLSLWEAQSDFGELAVTEYMVGLIRRFRPSVVVSHDREGEYGHGAHALCALCMEQAVPLAADPNAYPASAGAYGVWDTPKFYLHFAEENPIRIDVETPLASFGGRTAFQVATDAMQYHLSQLQYAHRPTLTSEDFPRYDCRVFGLVRSTVGIDTGNDIMEHISG